MLIILDLFNFSRFCTALCLSNKLHFNHLSFCIFNSVTCHCNFIAL